MLNRGVASGRPAISLLLTVHSCLSKSSKCTSTAQAHKIWVAGAGACRDCALVADRGHFSWQTSCFGGPQSTFRDRYSTRDWSGVTSMCRFRGRRSTVWTLKCRLHGRCSTLWTLKCTFRGRCSILSTLKCTLCGRCSTLWTLKCRFRGRHCTLWILNCTTTTTTTTTTTSTSTSTTISTFITTITSLDPNASRSLDFLLLHL